MDERREHPRYKVRTHIKYKKIDGASWCAEPHVENISLGGLYFEAYEKFSLGDELLFKLQIFRSDTDSEIIDVSGKIVGVEDGIVSYGTRVKFSDIRGTIKIKLKEFISYLKF